MRNTVFLTMAATLAVVATLISPASATSTGQALGICISRGTDCSVTNKDGGNQICVNNSGGKQCVNCPALTAKDQTCTMAKTRSVTGVTGVLKGGKRMSSKVGN